MLLFWMPRAKSCFTASMALAVVILARPSLAQDFKSWSCTTVQGNLTEVVKSLKDYDKKQRLEEVKK